MATRKVDENGRDWSRLGPPVDEFGNITRDNVNADGLLKCGPSPLGYAGGPPRMYRKSDNPVSREIYDEAIKERIERQPKAGYYRIRDVQAQADRTVIAMSKKLQPLSPNASLPDARLMSDAELVAWAAELLKVDKYDWSLNALPHQIEPEDYMTWLLSGGRGGGKTKTGSETVRKWCNERPAIYAVVALGHRELRDICLNGDSGLVSAFPPGEIEQVKTGLGDISIKLKSGAEIIGFTSGNPESLRGREFEACWVDEYAAYARSTAQDVLDQLWMCMRKSADPKIVITTTPRKVQHIIDLFKLAEKDESVVITHMSIDDNPHLSEKAVSQLKSTFGGTRFGRQELEGKLLLDVEGALWSDKLLSYAKMDRDEDLPIMRKVIVGYDYAGSDTGDPAGVVAVGWDQTNCLYVLENRTTGGSPADRYSAACMCAYDNHATEIFYEGNQGDSSKFGLEKQWDTLVEEGKIPLSYKRPRIVPSNLKGNKADRANPLVALYERNANSVEKGERPFIRHVAAHHTNRLAHLEDELTGWEPDARLSPNALDALVHAGRQAMRQTGYETALAKPSKRRRIDRGWQP